MIEDADKENRPPVNKIIDSRATLFWKIQFGSQLDNIDFVGLKKQEEDRAKEEVRQAQLRQTATPTGSSMGVLTSSGFTTPAEVYDMDDDDDDDDDDDMTKVPRVPKFPVADLSSLLRLGAYPCSHYAVHPLPSEDH